MGRTSKFSFPLPGRKHNPTIKDKAVVRESPSGPLNFFSKAQRILGTDNELNIDSPTQSDDQSWAYPSSRSSAMSISISESTHSTRSTNETGSISGSNTDHWEHESGVLPRTQKLRGKASSTLLGKHYGEDGATDASSLNRRMRHEGSDSTLKSYYDRQKSPPSISQQTSASSARDLALRKGFPPVIARSPLLHVDSVEDFEQFSDMKLPDMKFSDNSNEDALSQDRSAKKKPAKLDLSLLFPKSRKKAAASVVMSPNSAITNANTSQNGGSGRRKLTKAPSKESLQSHKQSLHSPRPGNMKERQNSTQDTLYGIYDKYEQLPVRSPRMDKIPESRFQEKDAPRRNGTARHVQPMDMPRLTSKSSRESSAHIDHHLQNNSYLSPADGQAFSWKKVRSNMGSPPWDVSSAASVSSHNTKTSRHTNTSVFSNQDLKQSSVLSLSSDSEEEASDAESMKSPAPPLNDKANRVLNGASQQPSRDRRQSQSSQTAVAGIQSSRKGAALSSPFLSIPEGSLPRTRISGPWLPPDLGNRRDSSATSHTQSSENRDKRHSGRPSSNSSKNSLKHSISSSSDSRDRGERNSRYMAVTQQEEALLEALRQKRARMREEIIEEHETTKTPPPVSHRTTSRYSEASSLSTVRGDSSAGERVLLYMRTPVSEGDEIDTAEPSPDLSDFLTFGSDEDSTPRTSWAVPKGKGRPDSFVQKGVKSIPMTPPGSGTGSEVRLSAVGSNSFRESRSESKKRTSGGVRFVDERKARSRNPRAFLLDENEGEVAW
jgi:hypothetical protein